MYEDLKLPKLSKGAHEAGSGELCIMEAIAFIEREPHSDSPECTSPVVAAFCRGVNDFMSDADRQRLWKFATRIAGTASPEYDRERGKYLGMKAVTVFAVEACEGKINAKLVGAMRNAKTLEDASSAAYAAARSACSAAAYAVASSAAHAGGLIDHVFAVLDGLLDIGPKGKFSHPERVKELCEQFA